MTNKWILQILTFLRNYHIEVTTLFLALIVRFLNISKSLWLDEAWAIEFARQDLYDLLTNHWERTPPLYYAFLKIWTELFGISELSIRFPSIIFGVSSLLIIYLLSRKLFSLDVARLILLLLAFSPQLIDVSQMARTYALFCFVSCLAFYRLLIWVEKQSTTNSIYLIISCCLLSYAHHFGLLNLIAIFCFCVFLLAQKKLKLFNTILVFSTIVLLYLPYLPFLGYQSNRLKQTGFIIPDISWERIFLIFDQLTIKSNQLIVSLIILIIIGTSLISLNKSESNKKLLYVWILIPLLLSSIYSWLVQSIFDPHYLVSLVYPISLVLINQIITLNIFKKIKDLILFAIFLSLLIQSYQTVTLVREDWRGITTFISKNYQEGDLIVVNPKPYQYPFQYYSSLPTLSLTELDIKSLNKTPRIWIVEPKKQITAFPPDIFPLNRASSFELDPYLSISLYQK